MCQLTVANSLHKAKQFNYLHAWSMQIAVEILLKNIKNLNWIHNIKSQLC